MPTKKTITLLSQIRTLIMNARSAAARSVDFAQVWTNYQIGQSIVHNEQHSGIRAGYVEKIIVGLSRKLSTEFGRGFAKRNLEYMRKFYLEYHDRVEQKTKALKAKNSGVSSKYSSASIAQSPIAQSPVSGIFTISWTHSLFLL